MFKSILTVPERVNLIDVPPAEIVLSGESDRTNGNLVFAATAPLETLNL